MEDMLLSVRLVRDACEVVEATDDLHLIRFEPRLHPEGASGPTLTGKAVTDGDGNRVARDFQTKLPAVTGGISSGQRVWTLPTRSGNERQVQRARNREQPKG
jgi:hypothetical protein